MHAGKFVSSWCAGTLIVLVSSGAATPGDARACENGVVLRVDPRTNAFNRAEQLVQRGTPKDLANAHKTLLGADPKLPTRRMGEGPLTDRGLVILARAAVRSGGDLAPSRERGAESDAAARGRSLAWATHMLQGSRVKHPDDPISSTDLAEAFARDPSTKTQALAVLERLESRDLVASAQGYAALVTLHAQGADGKVSFVRGPLRALARARRDLEQARCEDMAKAPEICR